MLHRLRCVADGYFEVAAKIKRVSCYIYTWPHPGVHNMTYNEGLEYVRFSCIEGYHLVGSDHSTYVNYK